MFGLSPLAVRCTGALLLVAVIASVGARLASIWYAPQLASAKAQIAASHTAAKAVQAAHVAITKADTASEDHAQATIQEQAKAIIRKVPVYVSTSPSPPVGCVTNGMLRLHDAAVLGLDPAVLPPPAAEPDAGCSTVSPSDFMATVAGNYATARANAEQLNALEDDISSRIEAIASSPK